MTSPKRGKRVPKAGRDLAPLTTRNRTIKLCSNSGCPAGRPSVVTVQHVARVLCGTCTTLLSSRNDVEAQARAADKRAKLNRVPKRFRPREK